MKELQALAYRDTTQENRDFWKNEMGNALREIQKVYEEKIEEMREELEKYYNMKVMRIKHLAKSPLYVINIPLKRIKLRNKYFIRE